MRHTLDGRRAGADDPDALTGQVLQLLARVAVVPAAGVERVPTKRPEAIDARQFGFGLIPVCHRNELGPHLVAPVGADDPAGFRGSPQTLMQVGARARAAVGTRLFARPR